MKLTLHQIGLANRHLRRGLGLREIARDLGVPFEVVCLALYGGNADWNPNTQRQSGTTREAPGGSAPGNGIAGQSETQNGPQPAAQPTLEPQPRIQAAQTAMPDGPSSIASHCGSSPAESESVAISAPIPPETANEKVGGFPVPAAPLSRGGTGGVGLTENDGRVNANPSLSVTAGETATSSLGEEGTGKPAGASAPAAPGLYRLRNELGEYLHEHERGMTRLPKFFWRGTEAEVVSLFKRRPHFKDLDLEPATVSLR